MSKGSVKARKIPAYIDIVSYTIKNRLRPNYLWNLFIYHLAGLFTKLTGIVIMRGQLSAKVTKLTGWSYDLGIVAHGVVTTAFCQDMVDELIAETATWGDYKHHDCGTGVGGAVIGDVGLGIPYGGARAVGNQVENTPVIYESVGTVTFAGPFAITEHGLFNNAAGVTLMDRHTFGAINVVNLDSIQFTYDLTCTAGG